MTRDRFRTYWTATGVIPRWQLLLVYVLIVGAGVVGFAKFGAQQGDIEHGQDALKAAVRQIQQSRIVLSRQSCRQRNAERAVTRSNLRQNLANLSQISDSALQALGFTRAEAVAQVRKQLRQVAPLDCKRLIRQVAGNKVEQVGSTREGGGQGSIKAPRPTAQRRSKVQTGPDGGSGPVGDRSPPQGNPDGAKPPPGGSPPSTSPAPSSGEPDDGVVTQPDKPVIQVPDVRDTIHEVAPRLCSVPAPLGPIIRICPDASLP